MRPGRRVSPSLVLLALALAAAAPTVAAHGPPETADYETALLVDHNDDCGEDGAGCRGTHDLIAVYLREKVDEAHGDVVVFKLFANAGSQPVRDVFTFKAGSAPKSIELTTSDNRAFTAGGTLPVARMGTGASLNDPGAPARFSLEFSVKASELGPAGTALSGFKVEAFKGTTKGDYMPGGFVNNLGFDTPNPDQGSQPTNRALGSYALRGPTYYVKATGPGAQSIGAGEEVLAQVSVANAFRKTSQGITVTAAQADGVEVRFHDAASNTYLDTVRTALQGTNQGESKSTASLHLALTGVTAGASGDVVLTITTDLGGRSTLTVPYTVTAGSGGSASDLPATAEPQGGGKGAAAPAPALVLGALGLALAVALRRRS